MRVNPPNARFWVWINGDWVKLTLKPSRQLSWHASRPTDEGYSYESETWSHEGDRVTRESACGGSDCDGPIHWDNTSECMLPELQYHPPEFPGPDDGPDFIEIPVPRPNWQRVSASQRDVYAETMGY